MTARHRLVAATVSISIVALCPAGPVSPNAPQFALTLGEETFDPLVEPAAVPAGWATVGGEGPALRLVQLRDVTHQWQLDDLGAAGIAVVQYVYPHAYIVWSEPAALVAARGVAAVRWAGEFHPAYKVLPRWRDLPDEPIDVKLLLYRGADTDAIVRAVADVGGRSTGRRVLNRIFEVAGFVVSGARFREIARIPGVYSIQPTPTDGGLRSEMSDQACAGNYDAGHLCFPGYPAWLSSIGIDGNGVIIANVDGGVQDSHPDLVSRMVPCSGQTCGGGSSSSHGTHTAGTMAADGASACATHGGSCGASASPPAPTSSSRSTARGSRNPAACCC